VTASAPPAVAADAPDAAAPAPPIVCPDGEIAIPATGDAGFIMGRGKSDQDTPHKVVLTHAFCIDANEVTAGEFEKCVDEGACRVPGTEDEWASYKRHPDQPIDLVDWEKSRQFCAARGKRLPTEAEWEWAASGPDRTRYPWGDTPEPSCDNVDYTPGGAPKWKAGGDVGCDGGGPSPVGTHPLGDKIWPSGRIHDLAGNVFEWTEDSFAPYPSEAQTDPLVRQETAVQAIRGGAWNRPGPAMETAFRAAAWYLYQVPGLGFRCVRGEPHPTPAPRQKKWGG
jgi:formylglycine-generating enzyme required for sulfatase activity